MMQTDPASADVAAENRFRQNLRSSLEGHESDRHRTPGVWSTWYGANPEEVAGARFFAALIGGLLAAFGLLWFLSFFGITVPLVAFVPVFLMVFGGALMAFALHRPEAGGN